MFKSHIFTTQFWRDYWIALRRSRRDAGDRRKFLLATLWLLAVASYYGGYLWTLRGALDMSTGLVLLTFTLVLLLTLGGRWFFLHLDARKARRESLRTENQMLRKHLASDTFALSFLLARSGSERYLREKHLPPNLEIITRRKHLDLLRQLELWDTLPSGARHLLLLPDGSWPQDAINQPQTFESLRCLRWVLTLDESLVPLAHLPRLDFNFVHPLIENPARLLSSSGTQDIWDIRVQRAAADQFFTRCYAELVGRGLLLKHASAEQVSWAQNIYNMAREPSHRDTLVQHNTIAELDEPTLRYVASLAWYRFNALQRIMDLIDDPNDEERWIRWRTFSFPAQQATEERSARD